VIGLIQRSHGAKRRGSIADEQPLIRLDDEGPRPRRHLQAQVEMRKRARSDQGAGKTADRRKAEDAVGGQAEAAVVQTGDSFDAAVKPSAAAVVRHRSCGRTCGLERCAGSSRKACATAHARPTIPTRRYQRQ
jgi:hypothetical protein